MWICDFQQNSNINTDGMTANQREVDHIVIQDTIEEYLNYFRATHQPRWYGEVK
jgi:hypothetical protein